MNAALRRISGEGDSENEWKRLFGSRRTFPEVLGEDLPASQDELCTSGPSTLTSRTWASEEAIVHRCCRVTVVALCKLGRVFVVFGLRLGSWLYTEADGLICAILLKLYKHFWQV